MKLKSTLFSLLAVAGGLTLVSCVDPYYAGGGTTARYEPGYVIDTLPTGYATVDVGGTQYYRYNDTYYRSRGNRYVVVEQPQRHRHVGPDGDRDHDGIKNWQDRRDDRRGDRYGRRDNRRDAYVRTLPRGYKVVTHRGSRYYVAGDTYYRPRGEGYVIVTNPF